MPNNTPKWDDTVPAWDDTVEVPKDTGISKGASALAGLQESTTAGYAGEIGGLIGGLGALGSKTAEFVRPGSDIYPGQSVADVYRQERDLTQKGIDKAAQANPGSYMAGEAGGMVLTAPIGGASVKGLAAIGAVEGLGRSNADLTKGEVTPALEDAVIGGSVAGGLGTLASKAGKIKDYLMKKSQDLSAKSLGYTANKVVGKEASNRAIGQQAIDRGIVSPGKLTDNMVNEVQSLKKVSGDQIGEVHKELTSLGMSIDTSKMVDNIQEKLASKYGYSGDRQTASVYADVMKNLKDTIQTPDDLKRMKKVFDDRAAWDDYKPSIEERMYRDLSSEMSKEYSNAVDFAVKEVGDPLMSKTLKEAKANYGFASEVERPLLQSQSKERMAGIGLISPLAAGAMVGSEGFTPEGIAKGIAVGYGIKKVRQYAPGALAVGMNKIAKTMNSAGKYGDILRKAMARGGEAAVSATHNTLMQNDAEYRKKQMGED